MLLSCSPHFSICKGLFQMGSKRGLGQKALGDLVFPMLPAAPRGLPRVVVKSLRRARKNTNFTSHGENLPPGRRTGSPENVLLTHFRERVAVSSFKLRSHYRGSDFFNHGKERAVPVSVAISNSTKYHNTTTPFKTHLALSSNSAPYVATPSAPFKP